MSIVIAMNNVHVFEEFRRLNLRIFLSNTLKAAVPVFVIVETMVTSICISFSTFCLLIALIILVGYAKVKRNKFASDVEGTENGQFWAKLGSDTLHIPLVDNI